MTPATKRLQVPIRAPWYCVVYLKKDREHRTAWPYRQEHAQRALRAMRRRFSDCNAIIHRD